MSQEQTRVVGSGRGFTPILMVPPLWALPSYHPSPPPACQEVNYLVQSRKGQVPLEGSPSRGQPPNKKVQLIKDYWKEVSSSLLRSTCTPSGVLEH